MTAKPTRTKITSAIILALTAGSVTAEPIDIDGPAGLWIAGSPADLQVRSTGDIYITTPDGTLKATGDMELVAGGGILATELIDIGGNLTVRTVGEPDLGGAIDITLPGGVGGGGIIIPGPIDPGGGMDVPPPDNGGDDGGVIVITAGGETLPPPGTGGAGGGVVIVGGGGVPRGGEGGGAGGVVVVTTNTADAPGAGTVAVATTTTHALAAEEAITGPDWPHGEDIPTMAFPGFDDLLEINIDGDVLIRVEQSLGDVFLSADGDLFLAPIESNFLTVVPEPSTFAMLATCGLLLPRRRRSRQ